jgi:hypothetical protein
MEKMRVVCWIVGRTFKITVLDPNSTTRRHGAKELTKDQIRKLFEEWLQTLPDPQL